ncbi:hypothetical protein GCM10027072_64130 [Streptomyces bullii]
MIVDHGRVVGDVTRSVITRDRRITGLTADAFAELAAYGGPLWQERHQARLGAAQGCGEAAGVSWLPV